jgi:acetyltransferase
MVTATDQLVPAAFVPSDEAELLIRPVLPGDAPLLEEMHASNSERTIRMRFFGMAPALSQDDVKRLCGLNDGGGFALAAVYRDAEFHAHIVGIADYSFESESGAAEFALVVSDAWQRHGLGKSLMRRLIAAARERGIRRLTGQVLIDNKPMLHLMKSLGFDMRLAIDPTVVEAEISLVKKPR